MTGILAVRLPSDMPQDDVKAIIVKAQDLRYAVSGDDRQLKFQESPCVDHACRQSLEALFRRYRLRVKPLAPR